MANIEYRTHPYSSAAVILEPVDTLGQKHLKAVSTFLEVTDLATGRYYTLELGRLAGFKQHLETKGLTLSRRA